MILYDFSSALHRSVFTASKIRNPHKKDGKFITSEFIDLAIGRVLDEILSEYNKYNKEYGDFVICIDDHSKQYWRKDIFPDYKGQRSKIKEESEIDWNEVYKHLNFFKEVLEKYSQFKVIGSPGAEADDIICLLTRKYAPHEKVLILSPDKDFKQLHKFGDIKQWSALTNKWILDDEREMEFYHPLLGDACDNVPRVVDFSIFSEDFKKFLKFYKLNYNELEFYKLDYKTKSKIIEDFEKDFPDSNIYDKPRFGKSTVDKLIKKFGSLDKFLDSNPIYRMNYELNKRLVLDSEIPMKIETDILRQYINSKNELDFEKIEKFLNYYQLYDLIIEFKNIMRNNSEVVKLTVDNCGW